MARHGEVEAIEGDRDEGGEDVVNAAVRVRERKPTPKRVYEDNAGRDDKIARCNVCRIMGDLSMTAECEVVIGE